MNTIHNRLALATLVGFVTLAGTSASAAKVTLDQVAQFKVGAANYADVTGELGRPFSIEASSDGTKTITYSATEAHIKSASFIPVVGLFAGGATSDMTIIRFTFDASGVLAKTWSSDTHTDCGSAITGVNCTQ